MQNERKKRGLDSVFFFVLRVAIRAQIPVFLHLLYWRGAAPAPFGCSAYVLIALEFVFDVGRVRGRYDAGSDGLGHHVDNTVQDLSLADAS